MKSFLCVDLLICALIVILACTGLSTADLEQSKNRRAGGTSGLFLFPRVGRNDPSMANNLHEPEPSSLLDNFYSESDEEYDDLSKAEFKRANLKLYPRVGRPDGELRKWAHLMALQQAMERRAGAGPSATSGLWFGPRLGKRSIHNTQDDKTHKNQNGQNENY